VRRALAAANAALAADSVAAAVPMFVDDGTIVGAGDGPLNSNVRQALIWRR
jgi:hypothetical protein